MAARYGRGLYGPPIWYGVLATKSTSHDEFLKHFKHTSETAWTVRTLSDVIYANYRKYHISYDMICVSSYHII